MKIHYFLILFVCVISFLGACSSSENSQSEKTSGKIQLIVNGDDVGIIPEYTDATLEALFAGKISSASLYAPGRDADRALEILKGHPEYSIGVHLTLTGDSPPLTDGASLKNPNGFMWDTDRQVAENANPEEAYLEWEAQILKVRDAGIKISHLDSHMGCYFMSADLFIAALRLSQAYDIPLIFPYWPGRMPEDYQKLAKVVSYTGMYTLPNGKEESLKNRSDAYWDLLSGLQPGINYMFTHQGQIPPGSSVHSDLGLRINEYAFWTSNKTHSKIKQMGIEIVPATALK